eukprot:15473355-Alexandrium_andersonii.AAC.1
MATATQAHALAEPLVWQAFEGLALVDKEGNPALRPRCLGVNVPSVAEWPEEALNELPRPCLLYTSPSPRD